MRACRLARTRSSVASSFVVDAPLGRDDLVVQVYGANTGVGKTIVSAGLCRAAARAGANVSYIKPVQTGLEADADAVTRWCASPSEKWPAVSATTLFHFSAPVSPHVAAALDSAPTPDAAVLDAVVGAVGACLDRRKDQRRDDGRHARRVVVVETAGGVLSPGPSGALQADLFRPLRLPALLVGDGRLGGIGTTLSALESLLLRGYDVLGVAMIGCEGGVGNADAVEARLAALRDAVGEAVAAAAVFRLPLLPPESEPLDPWFEDSEPCWDAMLESLAAASDAEASTLASFPQRAHRRIWWPFTQHRGLAADDITVIDSAHGDYYHTRLAEPAAAALRGGETAAAGEAADGSSGGSGTAALDGACSAAATKEGRDPSQRAVTPPLVSRHAAIFDGAASWWTQGVDRGGPASALALASAAGRYGHVMLPGNIHAPALLLAEEIVERGPGNGWADKVFFSDNGSTAVEIALKVAFRLYVKRRSGGSGSGGGNGGYGGGFAAGNFCGGDIGGSHGAPELAVVAQLGCYHGDTLGAMDVGAPSIYNASQHPWYRPRGLFLDVPTLAWVDGRFTVALPAAMAGSSVPLAAAAAAFPSRNAAFDLEKRLAEGSLADAYLEYVCREMDAFEGVSQDSVDASSSGGGGGNGGAAGRQAGGSAARAVLACLLLEPCVLGAGGMQLVDPLFQHVLVRECRRRGLPVVYDEVFSGLHRLGPSSARRLLGVDPDVACYAKLLTGGAVPLALTLASAESFAAFEGEAKAEALLHGHSYTAHPVGCAAALYALRSLRRHLDDDGIGSGDGGSRGGGGSGGGGSGSSSGSNGGGSSSGDGKAGGFKSSSSGSESAVDMPDMWGDGSAVRRLSLRPDVARCFSLGTVLALELASEERGYASMATAGVIAALRRRGVAARPLGSVIYLMVSPLTEAGECRRLLGLLEDALNDGQHS